MKYKVGDKVYLYSWDELLNQFGLFNNYDDIIDASVYWSKSLDKNIPKDRLIILCGIMQFKGINGVTYTISEEMIKCTANEYYLQEIKEEINEEV